MVTLIIDLPCRRFLKSLLFKSQSNLTLIVREKQPRDVSARVLIRSKIESMKIAQDERQYTAIAFLERLHKRHTSEQEPLKVTQTVAKGEES